MILNIRKQLWNCETDFLPIMSPSVIIFHFPAKAGVLTHSKKQLEYTHTPALCNVAGGNQKQSP